MKDHTRIDPLADDIIHRIDPKVRDSLSPSQLSAILEAIGRHEPGASGIDVRGEIPCFFSRFFFVFIVGRDRRAPVVIKEGFRRQRYSLMGGILLAGLVSLPLLLLALLFLYLLKYFWGLDLLPGVHLYDILN
jgi:hypothetical protein